MHGTSERMAVTLAAGLIIAVKAGVLQIANYGRLAFEVKLGSTAGTVIAGVSCLKHP